ncbi:MAG: zf-HC2 domain-containing protein [Sinobacteraceae bacterium]|nr:zf-HC2 domain-containing protein [Nevskiaceae bacterium]
MDTTSAKRELDAVLLHQIDAAYSFARWAVGHPGDAEEVVKQAITRVPQEHLRNGSARVWVLRTVRTAALDRMQSNGLTPLPSRSPFSDLIVPPQPGSGIGARAAGAELPLSDIETLRRAIANLALEQREVLLLRDTEGLSYRDIVTILAVPPATMTSRLWRARDALEGSLGQAPAPANDLSVTSNEGHTWSGVAGARGARDLSVPSNKGHTWSGAAGAREAWDHQKSASMMDAYIDAEVDIDTAAVFVQHIAQCRHCAGRLLKRSRLVQHIRSVTVCRAPEHLHRRMHRQLTAA